MKTIARCFLTTTLLTLMAGCGKVDSSVSYPDDPAAQPSGQVDTVESLGDE